VSPRAWRIFAIDDEATPFPTPLMTPPTTKMYERFFDLVFDALFVVPFVAITARPGGTV